MWAIKVFDQWRESRNAASEEQCPDNLLVEPNVQQLNYWLSRFVVEGRREDGKPYPASSISNILAGVYRHSKAIVPDFPNFMNRRDPSFCELTGAIQVRYRKLREEGVGAVVKHATVVTEEEEDTLWKSGVISIDDPLALQRAVFFYVGKVFCLRGGQEQRDLKPSQVVRSSNPDCYTYVENGSKTRSGFSSKEVNKVVPVYACSDSRPRCLVFLLDLYFSKFPDNAKDMDCFYLRPRKKFTRDTPWYDCAPVGKETMKKYMATMCAAAGIERKTNHSLRATGASAMFHAGVPEKLIRDVTGHTSNALHLYEHPTLQQKQEVSKILVQGKQSFDGKENEPTSEAIHSNTPSLCNAASVGSLPTARTSGASLGSLFSGLGNCNITISPQNFTVNVGSTSHDASSLSSRSVGAGADQLDINSLMQGFDLKEFWST